MTEITMIPIEYIILFAMAIVEVIKKRMPDAYNDLKPFIAFVIAITCNVVNAALFGGNILIAGKEAFIVAGVALAMFGGGTAVGRFLTPKNTESSVTATITQTSIPVIEKVVEKTVSHSTTPEVTVDIERSQEG